MSSIYDDLNKLEKLDPEAAVKLRKVLDETVRIDSEIQQLGP